MNLRGDDTVVASAVAKDGCDLLTITDRGYGKRTPVSQFPRKGRGTMGVRGIRLADGRGSAVVAAHQVTDTDELILVSSGGVLIRTRVADVSQQGRDASGVRVMNLDTRETVAAVSPVVAEDAEDADVGDGAIDPDAAEHTTAGSDDDADVGTDTTEPPTTG
jgi:DNA gyrase subunit A